MQFFGRTGYESRYTNFYRKQGRGLDLSRFTYLSKWLRINAKNVTNLLILLSVLAFRCFVMLYIFFSLLYSVLKIQHFCFQNLCLKRHSYNTLLYKRQSHYSVLSNTTNFRGTQQNQKIHF